MGEFDKIDLLDLYNIHLGNTYLFVYIPIKIYIPQEDRFLLSRSLSLCHVIKIH